MQQDKVNILGVFVDPFQVSELHQCISSLIDKSQRALILNVNVQCLNLSYKNPWLRQFLNQAEIVFCDGAGVILGGKILGYNIPERITYADWMWELGEFSGKRGDTYFLLGARPGVVEKAAVKLQRKIPNLQIVGTHHGYFDRTPESSENEDIIKHINELQPNILILGFGMPLQEKWLLENWDRLNVNVALTGGAVFDYISGDLQRAPKWMTDNGFEWLGRLIIEPKRLWRRYIVGNPAFFFRVLKQKFGLLKFQ